MRGRRRLPSERASQPAHAATAREARRLQGHTQHSSPVCTFSAFAIPSLQMQWSGEVECCAASVPQPKMLGSRSRTRSVSDLVGCPVARVAWSAYGRTHESPSPGSAPPVLPSTARL